MTMIATNPKCQITQYFLIDKDRQKVLRIFIPNKSEDDKNKYEKNSSKIVSLSPVINSLNSRDSAISMPYILM